MERTHVILACSLEEKLRQPRQHIKKRRRYFASKGLYSQSYDFSNNHVWMWELDHKESWVPKNWRLWTVVWRTLLRVPWTAERPNQSILKEISPELEGLMLKLKLQYFGHLIWRTDPDAGKDGRQEGRVMTEDYIVGWHHRLDGHEFEKSPGVGDGQGSLRCSPWVHRESDATEQLNWLIHERPRKNE